MSEEEQPWDDVADQIGGRFVGKGVYGCVFEPAPRCKDGRVIRAAGGLPMVGKIASDDITDELAAGKKIMALPRAAEYFAAPYESCEPALPILDPDTDKCPFLVHPEPGQKLSLLLMPLGGMRIDQWARKGRDQGRMALHFERILIHLLEGIAMYQSTGLIHNDIHPGNILVSDTGVGRIIDFGLSFNLTTVRTWADGKQSRRFRPSIIMQPPETFVWQMLTNGVSVKNGYKEMLTKFSADYMAMEQFKQEGFVYEMEEFVRASDDFRTLDGGVFARRYAKKWDTWRLGLVMWFEWNEIVRRPDVLRRPEVAAKFWNRRDILRAALRGLTRFDPRKRWSAPRALFELAPTSPWARAPLGHVT